MLRVMVVDEDSERRIILRQSLEQAGHQIVAEVQPSMNLSGLVAELQPDVIIIDTHSPDRDTLEHIVVISQDAPRPIVMFSADNNSEKIREAVRAGVSAYVVDGLAPSRVQPIIDVAIERFEELQALRGELQNAQTELANRKTIERAKGLLVVLSDWHRRSPFISTTSTAWRRWPPAISPPPVYLPVRWCVLSAASWRTGSAASNRCR